MWRNWQTHCTQNAADTLRAGSNPAIGILVWAKEIGFISVSFFISSISQYIYEKGGTMGLFYPTGAASFITLLPLPALTEH